MLESLRTTLLLFFLLAGMLSGTALAEEPATDVPESRADESTKTPQEADAGSALVLSPLERGQQFLAEQRYDEAIKEFRAALELKPTIETYVGLALALLRGREVLQPGDLCDPASFRAELEAHREEVDQTYDRCRFTCKSATDPISDRHHEINSAIHHLDRAAKVEPENIAIYEKLINARIALLQFDEEAACRQAMADVRYGTESDFGRITRMDAFELPSLMVFSGGMYPLDAGP